MVHRCTCKQNTFTQKRNKNVNTYITCTHIKNRIGVGPHKEIMLSLEAIDYLTNMAELGKGHLLSSCWLGGSKRFLQIMQVIVMALGYLTKLEEKTLLVKRLQQRLFT